MSASSNSPRVMSRHVLWRLLVGLVGTYAFTYAAFSLVTAGASRLGMHYDDALMLTSMLIFPLLLIAMLWAFAAKNLRQVALLLLAGAVLMLGLALLLVNSDVRVTQMLLKV